MTRRRYIVAATNGIVMVLDSDATPATPVAFPCCDPTRIPEPTADMMREELLAVAARLARLLNDDDEMRVAVNATATPPAGGTS